MDWFDEDAKWTLVAIVLILAITLGGRSCTNRDYQNTERMAQLGYCQGTVPGNSSLAWVPCAVTPCVVVNQPGMKSPTIVQGQP